LSELEFSSIPPLLSTYLPSLRSIDLSHNRLTRVPDLGALPHLTELRLRHNQLLHIEHLARNHPALVTLDLAQNQFQQLPTLCAELMSVSTIMEHNAACFDCRNPEPAAHVSLLSVFHLAFCQHRMSLAD
jgi:Leucine-rich repeat (LRR) protein